MSYLKHARNVLAMAVGAVVFLRIILSAVAPLIPYMGRWHNFARRFGLHFQHYVAKSSKL